MLVVLQYVTIIVWSITWICILDDSLFFPNFHNSFTEKIIPGLLNFISFSLRSYTYTILQVIMSDFLKKTVTGASIGVGLLAGILAYRAGGTVCIL